MQLKFGISLVWREQRNVDVCYFCLVNVKDTIEKNKHRISYLNMDFSLKSVPHSDSIFTPTFVHLPELKEEGFISADPSQGEEDTDFQLASEFSAGFQSLMV